MAKSKKTPEPTPADWRFVGINACWGTALLAVLLLWRVEPVTLQHLPPATVKLGDARYYEQAGLREFTVIGTTPAISARTADDVLTVHPTAAGQYVVTLVHGTGVAQGVLTCVESDSPVVPDDADRNTFVQALRAVYLETVPNQYRQVASRIADNCRTVAAAGYTETTQVEQALKSLNRGTLGFDEAATDVELEAAWQAFLGAGGTLSVFLEEHYPSGNLDWPALLPAIAEAIQP